MTRNTHSFLRLAAVAAVSLLSCSLLLPHGGMISAQATRLPAEMKSVDQTRFEGVKVRLDGSLELPSGQLYLLLAQGFNAKKNVKVQIDSTYPADAKTPDIIFYSNGWAHVRLATKGDASTLALRKDLPAELKKKISALKFPSDLIVPQGFALPRSYKGLIQDVPTVSLVDDAIVYSADFGVKHKVVARSEYKGNGTIFLTSITAGSITMLDGKTLEKIAEFPTEGTPCSMELSGGQLYVADEAKNRILIVDPAVRKFKGQIDLPKGSAPKGIAALPNGKWIYVSESGAEEIVCIETSTGKVLLKTKTHPGPGRMAVTPDGNFLLVLDVTSGELTIISTYNQQVIANVRVGDMPGALAVSNDAKLAYVSNRMSNSVSVVDIPGHHVVGTVKCGEAPTGITLSPDNNKLYVACGRENTLCIFDTKTLAKLKDIRMPSEVEFPGFLCLLPAGGRLLVCSHQTDALGIFDTNSMEFEKTLSLGHPNHEASWQPVP